jgi:glycosyltransferase involved in cell wall biosynthesis
LVVENCPYPQDSRVRREAEALWQSGYEVSVISPAAKGQVWCEVWRGVRVYRFPAPPDAHGFWGYAWEYSYATTAIFLLSLVAWAREGFDVIHSANPPETVVAIAAFYKLFGKAFIFDHHDLSPEMYCANFGEKRSSLAVHSLLWLEKLACRLADHVIATNESYKQIEMTRDGVPEQRITIVRNGPDLNDFGPAEPDPALRRNGKTVIVYVGVMGFHDGLDYLLRAMAHLVYGLGRTNVVCVLIGKGEMTESLKLQTADLQLDDYVQFTGWISESQKFSYLSSADICVDPDPWNPYNDRSTMIKIAEYMAMGKPIVAFDLRENRYTAQDAALFVGRNDEKDFAQALAQLMDDPARRIAMGVCGRRRVEDGLAWSYSVPHLLSVYHSVLRVPDEVLSASRWQRLPLWVQRPSTGEVTSDATARTARSAD